MTDWQPELRSKRTAPAKRPSIFWLLAALGAGLAVLSSVPVPWLLPTQIIAPSELHPESDTFDKPPIVPAEVPNSFLRARCLDEDRRFPLVLSPVEPSTSLDALAQWVQESRPLLQSWLEAYGAVIFRGFAGQEPVHFERVASAFTDRLDNVYNGTSPRAAVGGSNFVFSASEFAAWKVVPHHCEMSFLPRPPEHILFFAAHIEPSMWGGESPLVDLRAVTREMAPEVAAAFEAGGVRYLRHYPDAASSHPVDKLDFLRVKPWQDLFRHVPEVAAARGANTSAAAGGAAAARKAVEAESARQGFSPSWDAHGGLKLTHELPAFRHHPSTGERTWLNHLGVLHSAAWADEFAHAAVHLSSPTYVFVAYAFYALDWLSHALLGAEGVGQHVTHYGGRPISRAHVWHVRRLVWKHMLVAPWQQGDLMIIDNFRIAHARMPHADVPRRLWAAWSRPPASLE